MKRLFTILLILTLSHVNAQNCFWGVKSGSANSEAGRSVATDNLGNVYATGYFYSSHISFGSTVLNNHSSNMDLFITKLNSSGQVIWAYGFGGDQDEEGRGVATDGSNNLYLTGYFRSDSIVFGSTVLHNNYLGYAAIFVVKFDQSGTVLWAKTADNAGQDDIPYSITTNSSGVYLTGKFHSRTMQFDAIAIANSDTSASGYDAFIAGYDFSGNATFAKSSGGMNDEIGFAISTDATGIYYTGSFLSDTMTIDNYKLPNYSGGNENLFVVKCDFSGNFQWAKASQGHDVVTGYAICTSNNAVYVAGQVRGKTYFDTDSVQDNGWFDMLLLKYDPSGNLSWVKSFGGAIDDIIYGITANPLGNLDVTGIYSSDTVYFNSNNILVNTNSNNGGSSMIVEFDPNGDAIQSIGTTGVNTAKGISVNSNNDLFITGYYSGQMTMMNDTLSNSGYSDIFIAHPYSFHASVANLVNNSCHGDASGEISLSVTGGAMPIQYLWSNGASGFSINSLLAGSYSYLIIDSNNCALGDTLVITEPPADSVSICLVTVDSLSQHNVILWDKSQFTDVDNFEVYREISTSNYQIIGNVPFDSLSQFIDTVSSLYFPNTGDPNVGTYRYKIRAHNLCGGYSDMSPYHNTIYIYNNSGTFTWPQLYSIENSANPVSSYVLMRDDNSTGNWQAVGSVSGTQQTITDPMYSSYQSTASWRVQTQWSLSCSATYNYSFSNQYRLSGVGVTNLTNGTSISLSPNPTSNKVKVSSSELISKIEVCDLVGKILSVTNIEKKSGESEIDVSNLPKGIYIVNVTFERYKISKKLIVQ